MGRQKKTSKVARQKRKKRVGGARDHVSVRGADDKVLAPARDHTSSWGRSLEKAGMRVEGAGCRTRVGPHR